jgi:hypothetical protein
MNWQTQGISKGMLDGVRALSRRISVHSPGRHVFVLFLRMSKGIEQLIAKPPGRLGRSQDMTVFGGEGSLQASFVNFHSVVL